MSLDALAARLQAAAPADATALGLRVADTVGALLAGAMTREGRVLARVDVSPDATAFAAGAIRLTELDDIELLTCTTQSAAVVPAALAGVRAAGAAPHAFARGLTAGYVAFYRRALPIGGVAALGQGIWPSLLAAPLASAAAAALAGEQTSACVANALRLALVREHGRAGTVIPPFPSRWWLFGTAVAAGVDAARASGAGLAADPQLDVQLGDVAQRGRFEAPVDAGDLGRVSCKSVPTARQGANALEAFRVLVREQAIDPAQIEAVEVGVPAGCVRVIAQAFDPANRLLRIASAGFSLAAAAYDDALLRSVERDPPYAPELLALAARVRVAAEPALDAAFPASWPARVTILMRDGRSFERLQTTIPGDPERPFGYDDLVRKYPGVPGDALDDAARSTTDAAALARTLELVLATRERARRP
jgi:2-methylcitrate dehydratase PrpD